jgi:hypothetical protein
MENMKEIQSSNDELAEHEVTLKVSASLLTEGPRGPYAEGPGLGYSASTR